MISNERLEQAKAWMDQRVAAVRSRLGRGRAQPAPQTPVQPAAPPPRRYANLTLEGFPHVYDRQTGRASPGYVDHATGSPVYGYFDARPAASLSPEAQAQSAAQAEAKAANSARDAQLRDIDAALTRMGAPSRRGTEG